MEEAKMIINFSQIFSEESEVNLFELESQEGSYYLKNESGTWKVVDEYFSEIHHYNDIEDDEIRNSLLIKDNDI